MTTDKKVAEAVRLGEYSLTDEMIVAGRIYKKLCGFYPSGLLLDIVSTVYHYGVIEGKRIERAKRKKI